MAAVHDKSFQSYDGPRTPPWSRFAVITKYALKDAFSKKKTIAFLIAAAVYPLVASVFIYLHHNTEALAIFELVASNLPPINAGFFALGLKIQAFIAFLLVLVTGATLISTDMRDNALPLYLGRPIGRFEYVLGKFSVVALMASLATWVPLLVLFGLQVSLAGFGWLVDNLRIGVGIFLSSWLLILVYSMVCLASSALMQRKAAAEGFFVAFFIVLPILGASIDGFLKTTWGAMINPPLVLDALYRPLFGIEPSIAISVPAALFSFTALMVLCAFVLARRVKAYEVIK